MKINWMTFFQEIKDGAYAINFDEYGGIGNLWDAISVKNNKVTYFYSFGKGHIP